MKLKTLKDDAIIKLKDNLTFNTFIECNLYGNNLIKMLSNDGIDLTKEISLVTNLPLITVNNNKYILLSKNNKIETVLDLLKTKLELDAFKYTVNEL